tara:strand:+ start:83869 stop:84243 length:375 start_codon:yes stop_codon:yes gene_type:complete
MNVSAMKLPLGQHLLVTCSVALASLATGACGKKDEANCAAVSAHVIALARAEQAKDPDADRVKLARANLPTLQNALLQACEKQKWSSAVRECITRAKTPAETRECEPGLQTPAADGAATEVQKR